MSTAVASTPDRSSNSGSFDLHTLSAGRYEARGALTFATARRAREQGLNAIHAAGARELEIDCGGVTSADSAGLAVLLDWLAAAKRDGRTARFTKLPTGILGIARISEVEELLQQGV